MATEHFVIIGGAHAGGRAAGAFRKEGHKGKITVTGSEPHRPYNRPPLSKGYLQDAEGLDAVYLEKPDFYEKNDIALRGGVEATGIDLDAKKVTLSDGEPLAYDKLLLTTGAEPRRFPGEQPEGLFYLRSIEDSDAIKKAVGKGTKVVVIGGSWIACEVAASLRQRGAEVELLIRGTVPFENTLGAEVGEIIAKLHTAQGVSVRTGMDVTGFEGDPITGVNTASGETIPCEVAVAGVGVTPRTALAEAAGLTVNDGIVTNEFLETSAPDVFAAGDAASALRPFYGRHVRVEHWDNAENQGPAAARNMLGGREPYDKLPYFFSDQYDFSFEYVGYAPEWDEVVLRGKPDKHAFAALYLKDGLLVAGLTAGLNEAPTDAIEKLIRAQKPVPTADLSSKNLTTLT